MFLLAFGVNKSDEVFYNHLLCHRTFQYSVFNLRIGDMGVLMISIGLQSCGSAKYNNHYSNSITFGITDTIGVSLFSVSIINA